MSTPKKSAKIIDGKKLADDILLELAKQVRTNARRPGLATIMVGSDPASKLYVKNKKRAAEKIGIDFHEYQCGNDFYPDISQKELIAMAEWLNRDTNIDAIIIQVPLPKPFDLEELIDHLDPAKDADGFQPKNRNQFLTDRNAVVPPLIQAIAFALKHTEETLTNKHAVIISKNELFSQSLDKALEQDGLQVTTIAPTDKDLAQKTQAADILISVVGKPHFITPRMVKAGAIVIDAGTVLDQNDTLVGDVDPAVADVASWITPVPGGIGPLTVAMLLHNVIKLADKNKKGPLSMKD